LNTREPFAYVVGVTNGVVTLNVLDSHIGQLAAHAEGVSAVAEVGALFGIDGGTRLLVLRVLGLKYDDPREAHRRGVGSTKPGAGNEPLRQLEASVMGFIESRRESLATVRQITFTNDALATPPLGAGAVPLLLDEKSALLTPSLGKDGQPGLRLMLGEDIRGGGELQCDVGLLLSRHVAVLGSTGQGKSCLTAAVLQQIVRWPKARVVVFDINGEYSAAFAGNPQQEYVKTTVVGGSEHGRLVIPYYALGRQGLSRLLLPSDKTQRPALAFALDHLHQVTMARDAAWATLSDDANTRFVDDGSSSSSNPADALAGINRLREPGRVPPATHWPQMLALACLVAESHAFGRNYKSELERSGFLYGNVAPLITRIRRFCDDPQFCRVVDTHGGSPVQSAVGDDHVATAWALATRALFDQVFVPPSASGKPWRIHILDLRQMPYDLMPFILGSLLEVLGENLFRIGQERCEPTLLVLEEAHHYLRPTASEENDGAGMGLAYERLAKEGRKYGLGLWVSTQRPSEVSPTVLSQCGTWAAFRLTAEKDIKAIESASEWSDRHLSHQIAGLPRRQAVLFGSGVTAPTRIIAREASPTPKSEDPRFDKWKPPVA
jgi:hypothetical protein